MVRFYSLGISTLILASVACSTASVNESADPGTGETSSVAAASVADLADKVRASRELTALKDAAKDVDAYEISVKDIAVPTDDAYTGVQLANGFRTTGLDWFRNPAVSYPSNKSWSQGSDVGKKCQWAAIFRFEAIFSNAPPEAVEMKDLPNGQWKGSFWSWTDDSASTKSIDDPTKSYAWSSGLWKWIGASGAADAAGDAPAKEICRLPTKKMVVGMMKACLETARAHDGDAKGCRMPEHSDSAE